MGSSWKYALMNKSRKGNLNQFKTEYKWPITKRKHIHNNLLNLHGWLLLYLDYLKLVLLANKAGPQIVESHLSFPSPLHQMGVIAALKSMKPQNVLIILSVGVQWHMLSGTWEDRRRLWVGLERWLWNFCWALFYR